MGEYLGDIDKRISDNKKDFSPLFKSMLTCLL